MDKQGGLYKNRYRIKSARWEGYNYSQEGFYFVTICTKNRELFFGDVVYGKMILSEIGKLTEQEWLNTNEVRKNVELDRFVVMPNHVHGIFIIKYKILDNNVETHCNASLHNNEYKNKFGPQSNNLPAIVRGFKGAVKNKINKNFSEVDFSWQGKFYDRVIRNEDELNRIRQYIIDNPIKWELDRNNPKNFN